jgi:hypothetical protein
MRVIGTYARLLRASKRAEKAEAVCRAALSALSKEQLEFEVMTHPVRVEHAAALWDVGRRDEALALLDLTLDEQEKHDNPLLRGLTHKARAQMALESGDAATFRAHLDAMDEWFRRTDNASLIAQCHALADEGTREGLLSDARQYAYSQRTNLADSETKIRAAFGRCRGPADRLQTALEMVMATTGAERGYLYLVERDGGLRFAAPLVGHEPPEELKRELATKLEAFCNRSEETAIVSEAAPAGMQTVIGADDLPSVPPAALSRSYGSVFLVIPGDGQLVAVGAIALIPSEEPLHGIAFGTLEEIARGIYDAADVQTVFLGVTPPVSSSARSREPPRPSAIPPPLSIEHRARPITNPARR